MTLFVSVKQSLGNFQLDATFHSTGGVTALFGRSGSGKTALIRIIAGLSHPDNGRVTLGQDTLTDTYQRRFVPRHKRHFGVVFQESRLFPHMTVRQNLLYGRWFSSKLNEGDALEHVLELLGISHLIERRPENLSGGEKQRVAIGRALLSNPRLLLMDEPLSALDQERKAEILPYLERLRDEMKIPIVYVSHSVEEVARLADHVIVMRSGKVVHSGAPQDVLSQEPVLNASGRDEQSGVLLEGTIESHDASHGITTVALSGSKISVLSAEAPVGRKVRVVILARDVMLATQPPEGISALNVLRGIVSAVTTMGRMVEVQVDCDGDMIRSRITSLSLERLNIREGAAVYAVIKTAALQRY